MVIIICKKDLTKEKKYINIVSSTRRERMKIIKKIGTILVITLLAYEVLCYGNILANNLHHGKLAKWNVCRYIQDKQ